MKPEPLKKNHIFTVNLDGDGVASEFPKDEEGNDACTSDNWIHAVGINDVKAAVKWLENMHRTIKDEFLLQFKDKKIDQYLLGNYCDMVSNLWLLKIKTAFPDLLNKSCQRCKYSDCKDNERELCIDTDTGQNTFQYYKDEE